MIDWNRLLEEDVLVPIVAIVSICTLAGAVIITKLWIRHRERLAMIEKGMDPNTIRDDGRR